jgi:hypothetical protein
VGRQLADARQGLRAPPVGETAVVPDADEPGGQDVPQETPEELHRVEPHDPVARAVGRVLPAEADGPVVQCNEALVGDGHPMGVPGQVFQHLGGPPEGRFGVDHPVLSAQPSAPRAPGGGVCEGRGGAVEPQRVGLEVTVQPAQEDPAKQAAEDTHR